MPKIASDFVDTYVFRRVNARPQFLVLRGKEDTPAGNIWQSIHTHVEPGESGIRAARRDVIARTGIEPVQFYTADYIAQFYDPSRDSIVLAATFAAQVEAKARVALSEDYIDYAWCDLEETTARLMWNSQRWAVRHIYDVIAIGGEESELYRI